MRLEYEKRPDPCPARKRLVIRFLVVLLMVETFSYVGLTIKQIQSFQNEATNLNEVHTDGNAVHDTRRHLQFTWHSRNEAKQTKLPSPMANPVCPRTFFHLHK